MPAPLGSGLAQGAADIQRLHKLWYPQFLQAQAEGRDFPQFEQWLMMQGVKLPGLPSAQQQQGVSLSGIQTMPAAAPPQSY